MSILARFKNIMTSNINALLDKAEDPEKMVDQILRDLNKDLRNVKSETATIMAEEKRQKRELDELLKEIEKMESYAVRALEEGNEDDARKFLERKKDLTEKEEDLKSTYELSVESSLKMKEMHDKLTRDIDELEARKNTIKSKMSMAKTQEKLNNIGSSTDKVGDSLSAFDRMEAKANQALDKAEAMSELNESVNDSIEDLTKKYDLEETDSIDDELERLKSQLKDK